MITVLAINVDTEGVRLIADIGFHHCPSNLQVTAGTGKTRDAAILMVDIRGFTHLATIVEPDDLVCLLADYQSRIVPIIQHHGGAIDKFMGDGIMATFGAAVSSDDKQQSQENQASTTQSSVRRSQLALN